MHLFINDHPPPPPQECSSVREPSARPHSLSLRSTTVSTSTASALWFAAEDLHDALDIKQRTKAIKRVPLSERTHRWFPQSALSPSSPRQSITPHLVLLPALSPKAAYKLARRHASRHPNGPALTAHILALTISHHRRSVPKALRSEDRLSP